MFPLISESKSFPCDFPMISYVISVFPVYFHNIWNIKNKSIDVTQQFFPHIFSWFQISLLKFVNSLCFPCLELLFPIFPVEWKPWRSIISLTTKYFVTHLLWKIGCLCVLIGQYHRPVAGLHHGTVGQVELIALGL